MISLMLLSYISCYYQLLLLSLFLVIMFLYALLIMHIYVLIYIHRGQHRNAMDLCMKAGDLLPSPSHFLYVCVGLSTQYEDKSTDAVRYIRAAKELLGAESYTDSLPFLGLSMTEVDIDHHWLRALSVNGEFDACVDAGLHMMTLPQPELGGATILAFSFVNWSVDKIADVNRYGEEEVSGGRLTLPQNSLLYDEVRVYFSPLTSNVVSGE